MANHKIKYTGDELDAILDLASKLEFDTKPTENSQNVVTSSGIKEYIDTAIQDAVSGALEDEY